MKKKRKNIRRLITQEAARLMFEEGVDQYLDAKRKAAKRVVRGYTIDLPSNGEIANELHQLAMFHQGDELQENLFKMRLLAMDVMEHLEQYSPRLIGSVSTGRIRGGSDIDLHLFTDSIEELESTLQQLQWHYELKQVWIQKDGRPKLFNHIYLDFEFPVELSVYSRNEIRVRGRSSTDGKPIHRLSVAMIRDLVLLEHHEEWQKEVG